MRGFPHYFSTVGDISNLAKSEYVNTIGTWIDWAYMRLVDIYIANDKLEYIGGSEYLSSVLGITDEATMKAFFAENFSKSNFTLQNTMIGGAHSLKGNCHCHSNNSDGALSPSAMVTDYKNLGHDFIILTDHDKWTVDPEVPGIIYIGGCERTDLSTRHFGCYPGTSMMTLNHARWTTLTTGGVNLPLRWPHGLFEIWNWTVPPLQDSSLWFDYYLIFNTLYCTSNDDRHDAPDGATYNIIYTSDTPSGTSILSSLAAGNFYASSGNDISISVTENTITASSVAASNFEFIGRVGLSLKSENGVTSSSYTPDGWEKYVRVVSTLASDATKKAWSQPIRII